ncbi:MAG TPA: aldo/keto reductase [Chloroflexota bacterium]|nr:aldo/keto reductase [Chloroflexota bacterium]
MSELGLGTYPLGGALITSGSYWSGPATYGAVAGEEAVATVRAGLARGLNFVDTAPNYAAAEEFIGTALRQAALPAGGAPPGGEWGAGSRAGWPGGGRCYVATKCGEHVRPNPATPAAAPELARDFSRGALRESLARSRRRLGLERLPLVLLHSPEDDELGEDPLGLLVELRQRGEIEHVGESARSVQRAVRLIGRDGRAEVIQVPFNLLEPAATRRLLPLAAERGVGIVVRSPLASGFLTGTIGEDHVFGPDDHRSALSRQRIVAQVRRARAFAWLVDEGIAGSLAGAALRYILSFPGVSTVIAGAMRREELGANLDAVEPGPLPEAVLARIARTQQELGLLGA